MVSQPKVLFPSKGKGNDDDDCLFVPEKLSTPGLSLTFDSSSALIFTPNSKLVTLWVNCTNYRQVNQPLTSRAHQACSAIKLVLQDWTSLMALYTISHGLQPITPWSSFGSNISNTRDGVSSGYPNIEKRVENLC